MLGNSYSSGAGAGRLTQRFGPVGMEMPSAQSATLSASPMLDSRTHPSQFMDRAAALVAKMTLEEKAALCSGSDFWRTKAVKRLDIDSFMVSDGPHGLRKQGDASDHLGLGLAVPATCFPTAGTLAAAWDPDLCWQLGQALGKECVAEDISVVLGPGINIKRNPKGGRNFEYFSEDPMLTGLLAAAFIKGVQSCGIGTSLKHYAANNQEFFRMVVDTRVDERTLRELYLPAFEHAVRDAQPWTVMCGYNRVNGVSRPSIHTSPSPSSPPTPPPPPSP